MECPHCGKNIGRNDFYDKICANSGNIEDRINIYGTFCPHCEGYIDSNYEIPIVKENKLKKEKLLEKARESIKKKWREKYDNKNR
jgi:hypothetical protein